MAHIYGLNMHKSLSPLIEGGILLQNPAILLAQEPPLRILDKTAKKELQTKVPKNMGNNILIYKGDNASSLYLCFRRSMCITML